MATGGSTFQSTEPLLDDLLKAIGNGKIQLPDFQRGWVWDDEHIRSLIASVTLSYPIGAVMLLQTGGEDVRFKPRPVEGVEPKGLPEPEELILDGQQRLTSLYLALKSGRPVPTRTDKGQEIKRVYYVDMALCLDADADRLDAIRSLPPDRQLRSDFGRTIDLDVSTRKLEFENGLMPLALIYDFVAFSDWRSGYQRHFNYDPERVRFVDRFEQTVHQPLQKYQVPVITLLKSTEKAAVCQVFERVNTGGVVLSVFELVTATFAADDFQLRDDWRARRQALDQHPVLMSSDETNFLTAVTLLSSYQRNQRDEGAVSCKRRDVLRLTLDDYCRNAGAIQEGFRQAAQLLHREKIYDARTLPYTTQLVPLAAICAWLGERCKEDPVRKQLARWYWCGVFGEMYGGANESRMALDLPQVVKWIDGGEEPRTVRDAGLAPTRLLSLRSRQSAAYKGLMARLMQIGSPDLLSGDDMEQTLFFDEAVDIHHLFPRAWCQKQTPEPPHWDCIVNKAPLSSRTNRILSGRAPSDYLRVLEISHKVQSKAIDHRLSRHLADAARLREDDYHGFLIDRAWRLLDEIERAMGKPIAGRDAEEVVQAFGAPLTSESASRTDAFAPLAAIGEHDMS